jgi:hypothetical protein
MKIWIKVIFILLLLGIIAGILGYFFVYNKPHKDVEKAKPDFILTAAHLYKSFTVDQEKAANIYNGMVLQITGELGSKEDLGEMVVLTYIFDEGLFGPEGVRCTMLPQFHKSSLSLKAGDTVVIKGLCKGFTGTDVILDKCSILQ